MNGEDRVFGYPTVTTYLLAWTRAVCRSVRDARETEIYRLLWLQILMERINVIPISELKISWYNAVIIDYILIILSMDRLLQSTLIVLNTTVIKSWIPVIFWNFPMKFDYPCLIVHVISSISKKHFVILMPACNCIFMIMLYKRDIIKRMKIFITFNLIDETIISWYIPQSNKIILLPTLAGILTPPKIISVCNRLPTLPLR